MSRWFRHYAGMMRDEKLVRVAVKAKQPVERVVWVWGAILESAAEINDGGRYEFDAGEAAYFLRCDESDLVDVVAGLVSLGRLADGMVARWADRQFDSDSAKERQRRYRERQKSGNHLPKREGDVGTQRRDVTPPSRDGAVTLQETDTEKEIEPNGSLSETSSDAKPKSRGRRKYPDAFEAVWLEYPTDPNMSKAEALDAWTKLDAADKDALAASIRPFRDYCRANPDYRPIHMCRFIAKRRFDGFQSKAAPPADGSRWQTRLNLARDRRQWSSSEWGPPPGSPGCRAPPDLLRPDDGNGWSEWKQVA